MGCHLSSFKEITSFYWRKIHAYEEAAGKRKVLETSLNGSCMMVFKKFAGQLMYALGPLPQPLKDFDNLLASEKLFQLTFCVKFRKQFGTIPLQKYMHWSNTLGEDRFLVFVMLQFSLSLKRDNFCSKSID